MFVCVWRLFVWYYLFDGLYVSLRALYDIIEMRGLCVWIGFIWNIQMSVCMCLKALRMISKADYKGNAFYEVCRYLWNVVHFQIQQFQRIWEYFIDFCLHTQVWKKIVFSEVTKIIFTSTDDGWTFCWNSMCCTWVLHQTGNTSQQLLTMVSVSVWLVLISYCLDSRLFVILVEHKTFCVHICKIWTYLRPKNMEFL